MEHLLSDPRSSTNPLFNANRLKLGVFGHNGPPPSMTLVPELFKPTWENSLRVSQLVDQAKFEAIVPYARWRPFGAPNANNGRVFETATWAAATAAQTNHSAVMATLHTSALHPLVAAKEGATIDHISSGRFAINIVCGWFVPEIEMFGAEIRPHADRYAHAHEWIELMKLVWSTEEPIDFEGRYVKAKGAVSLPKPIQQPFPALMNAGGSGEGQHFAAKHCDIAFVLPQNPSPDAIRAQVQSYRTLAREEYGREIQVWCTGYVVQSETEREAKDYVRRYVEDFGDNEAADMFIKYQMEGAKTIAPEVIQKIRHALMAGAGGIALVGTADQIADKLKETSDCGLDGILLSWIDYEQGMRDFTAGVLPKLVQMGLRA